MRKKMILALSLLVVFSATIFAQNDSNTEFTIVSQIREVPEFQSIEINGRFVVKLYASDQSEVSVITAEKFIDNVETVSTGGALKINMKDKSDEEKQGVFDGLKTRYNDYLIRQPIEIHIGVKNINIINLSGVTTLETDGKLNLQTLYMSIGDASKANLDVEIAKEFYVSLTGASKLEVSGTADVLTLGVHGACSMDGKNLKVKNAKVELSGAARAEIHATEALDADLKGASKLVCNGSPKSVKQSVTRASAITIR